MSEDKFSCYSSGEGITGGGQLLGFTYPVEKAGNHDLADTIRAFLKENVRDVTIPITGSVHVGHGGYGMSTRYDVTQHKYAGGGYGPGCGGYIEVLEIKNPPDGRWGIVINEYLNGDEVFTEWETLEQAIAAWEKYWSSSRTEGLASLPGFKRRVVCGRMVPWFYAIGDERLIGDYAFPEGLQDDPVYRFGKQFVVFNHEGVPSIKTCMGTRFLKRTNNYTFSDRKGEETHRRLVHWDDGSVWDEENSCTAPPRPAEDGELWVAEAVREFRELLAGEKTDFAINFTDGTMLVVAKTAKSKFKKHCVQGRYDLKVIVEGEKKPREGYVDFTPTQEFPDIASYVVGGLGLKNVKVLKVEVKSVNATKGGKKWSGVFFQKS